MKPRNNCPCCKSSTSLSSLFLKKNIQTNKITNFSYSSRKIPEFMNHELIRCKKCNLVYTVNPPSEKELLQSYEDTSYDSDIEAKFAAKSYLKNLKKVKPVLFKNNNIKVLEIGSGNNAFLRLLNNQGISNLIGIEPSHKALGELRNSDGITMYNQYQRENFQDNSLDLICCYMTLEHILNPGEMINESIRTLKSGGSISLVVHDVDALLNKLLGKFSPIIDIEHLQIFSKKTIKYWLSSLDFKNVKINSLVNSYPISYWIKLLPIPKLVKKFIINLFNKIGISNYIFSADVGNLFIVADKK